MTGSSDGAQLPAGDGDDLMPVQAYDLSPVVGLGGSAGSISALKTFFEAMPTDSGLAFVVVMHLSPEHESTLPELLQRVTSMPVKQVSRTLTIEPDTVYVIPPRFGLKVTDGQLELEDVLLERGRHVAVDLFFRTLADTHRPHAAAVVLSGADGDGAIGIKRIKERGGLTIAQDPQEAEHAGMPRTSIATGMVDWVLPVADIPQRLLDYFNLEDKLRLPPEDGPQAARLPVSPDEASLRDVLTFLRTRTGRDFSYYKRATILRRIGRRMQVNGVHDLPEYLGCLRTRPGEAGALLQDLLISVTNFFRDRECFEALERELPSLFAGKGPNDAVRVWIAACATGEEAYSIAMLLAEQARAMDAPPLVQIFATDLDDEAVQVAREGVYPVAIEADVDEERLKRFFVKEHRGWRVRRELREMVLFAMHDVLKDSPFSRLDLVSCRNLLIYLNREAQARVFDTFHFALLPGGRLFLGSSESVEDGSTLFNVVDKKHRIYQQRPTPRAGLPVPSGPGALALALEAQHVAREGPVLAGNAFRPAVLAPAPAPPAEPRTTSWGELHLRLLELLAPPSILVDAEYDIVHLSPGAGRFLQISGGEPSRNLLRSVNPSLRIELRAALYQAAQSQALAEVAGVPVEVGGEQVSLTIRVLPAKDMGAGMYLVVLHAVAPEAKTGELAPQRVENEAVARHLDRELERLKSHLRNTVEQYAASTEELKASNEELQAMNEELRSATEELETSREELQSVNEELTTVNHELKNKVDELGHANSDMQNLMDATAIATVFLDREVRITRYTPSAVSLFNLIPTDVGRPLTDLKTQLHYPELGSDAARVLEKLVPIEREVGQADGSWYLARLLPYRTIEDRIAGVVLSFIDITERKQAEMRLWLSAVVTSSSDAIISFSLDGTILSWNGGAERIYGYTAAEAIGKKLSLLAADDSAEQQRLIARIAAAESIENHEAVRRRKDGSELNVSITVSPIRDETGKVMAGTAMVRDITAAKRGEEALRRALAENEQARIELQAADVAKDRFLAVLSHELRNPLAAVNTAAELLASGGARSEDMRSAAQIVQRQGRSMKALLDDLLDVSRVKLGRLELKRERVRLSAIVANALETTKPLLSDAGHRLDVDLPPGDVELEGDPLRLCQVVANLLANAIRYTPAGGRIRLAARLANGQLEITVKDDGIGMDPQRIESLFEMFTQGDVEVDRTHGLGIGLALVKQIVELHGGRVSAQSTGRGQGSEFRVELPGATAAAPAPPAASAAPASKKNRGLVLVADDNADAGWGTAKLLEFAGFETLQARGGAEALEAMARHKPDAAIVDIAMPDVDGHEVARRARAAPWGQRMVLVAATGYGQASDEAQALAAGFDEHLTKPVDLRVLAQTLDRLLARKRG